MPAGQLFDQVMDGGLRDWLKGLSAARAEALALKTQRHLIGVVAAAVLAALVALLTRDLPMAGFVAFGVYGMGYAWANGPVKALSADIKVEVNSAIANRLGAVFQAEGVASADYRVAERFDLLPKNPDEEEHTDFWSGPFDGADLQVHESHLQEWQSSGKSRRLVTIFRGAILGYRFARDFHGVTIVRQERNLGLFSAFAAPQRLEDGRAFERVRMVDPRFEDTFEVWSTDQVEARYLVHPAFCERLMALEEAFHAKSARLVFCEGRVAIVLETEDQFESGGIDADGDDQRIAATIGQIESLLNLSRSLNERPRS